MKKRFTILIAAIAAILMMAQPVKVVGQERAITMGSGYTVINTVLTSVSNNDLVVWGTSNTTLGYEISSNKLACNSTSSNWIVFKVIEGTNGFYLQNTDDNKYVYSSAAKKIEFHATSKTLFTIVDKGSDHTNILFGANVSGNTTTNIGYYTYNNDASGIRPYASNAYTDAHLYKVIPPHTLNYSATNGNITGVNSSTSATVNTGASLAYGTVVNLTANPADGYEFESWSDGGTNTLSNINGNHATFTMGEANVTITATFTEASSDPTITASPASLSDFSCVQNSGNASASKSFTVSGANLEGNINFELNENSDFEISADNSTFGNSISELTPTTGTVAETTIYVRLKASTSAGDKSGSITISSTNATTCTIQLSGTVLAAKTITWHHGAGGASTATTNTYVGATLTELPTAATVNGWTFIGWAASYSSGYPVTVTAPLTVTAGMGDFHAVYRHGNNVIYQLTTSTSDLSAGTRYMMGYTGYVLMKTDFSATTSDASLLDENNQYVYSSGAQYTLGSNSSGWYFTDANAKYLSSQNLGSNASVDLKLETDPTDYSYWTIDYDNQTPKHALIVNAGNHSDGTDLQISYYSSKTKFNCYTSYPALLFKEVTEYSKAPTVDLCYVTYDANGATEGDVPTDGTGYNQGASVTVAGQNTLAKTGYTWAGWCLNAEGNGTVYGPTYITSYTINANTTFYAKWDINSYQYTLDDSDEHVAAGLEVGGESYTASTIPYNTEVEVVVGTDDGYGYTISVKDADDNDVTLTNNTFNMPSSTVTITVTSRLLHTYTLVTDASQIVSGKHYILVNGNTVATDENPNAKAMGMQNYNSNTPSNRAAVPVRVFSSNDKKTVLETEGVYEFVINGTQLVTNNSSQLVEAYTIYDVANEGFLSASSSSSNNIKFTSAPDNNAYWTISIGNYNKAAITAQGSYSRNLLRYNSSSSIFSCYGQGQADGYLYVKNDDANYDFYKYITAATNWSTASNGWNFIASPVDSNINPADVNNMLTADDENGRTYDLYRLNVPKWENYQGHTEGFVIANGTGYLYANKNNTTLKISGSSVKSYSTDDNTVIPANSGWNLIGNPYTFPVKVSRAFSELNNSNAVANKEANSTINPGAGIAVYGIDAVTFTKYVPEEQSSGPSNINVILAQQIVNRDGVSTGSVTLDNAVISFNEGSVLPKFNMLEGDAKLYIPQGNEEYAIVSSEARGEMPVCFKANRDGQFTINVNAENVEMNYLHLIDNIAGTDIDLIATPSYTFDAKGDDYESRFRLVFSASQNENENQNEDFAFISNGEIIVNGTGTLQIIDIMGRVISTRSTEERISTNGMTPGVYVLRLIGNDTKTQKIVVK